MKYKKLQKIAKKLQKIAPWAIDDNGLWFPKKTKRKK